ncbi:MAG: response regulator [Deltaproteobacteria bacterium]|nr:response regulator [Deltaproteobacteria bacterium]MBI5809761.1 response regulator [Deltaproteobacteria bacterium]
MKRILIIDDEWVVCSFFEKILPEEGYEVISTLDARAGLRLVKKLKPDLVIIDMNMPGINGMEGLRLIKETSDIPVIIVTGYGTMETVREAMRLGAYDYITKPFDLDIVKAAVSGGLKTGSRASVRSRRAR